ncbi:hypothetical protein ATY41_03330 [Leifsonia xyli subsp. xyli]|uniref:Fragment of phage protein n=2 Tax=Leifsonia xyli subsp. xyli TaxID=59736 RepID=Q6ACE2_LEIXX|nr:recombinase family protein [Leifsonia xyli]AAT89951.1 fragment of phage protein [Leifsonia xyli subsp. xyli str. CTCB07]ODA90069.1 hypothetical protein ATY41_03330 [Leifsonia xyli subsp. xyli]
MTEAKRARRRAVLYVRISDDPHGLERGVDRQEEDCRAVAATEDLEVVAVFRENDTSAFKQRTIVLPSGEKVRRVIRPKFRAMLQLLANDGGDVLIAYDLDRAVRDPRDLEDLTRTLRILHGAGYDTDGLVVALARGLSAGTEQPARTLQRGMIRAVKSGRFGRGRARLVAGITPAAPTADAEYGEALAERARLIQEAAHADLRNAHAERAAWLPAGGRLPAEPDAARTMLAALQVVAVYRAKHGITADDPLGSAPEEGSEQVQEYTRARAAYAHALGAIASTTDNADVGRPAPHRRDVGLSR